MQIVIDIPEGVKDDFEHEEQWTALLCAEMREALRQGTPLSEAKWQKKKVEESTDIDITAWQVAQCSNCKRWHTTPYMYYFYEYKYCPFCGMKMEVEE